MNPTTQAMSAIGTARGLLKSLRPHQWVKNSFVLAPAVFSLQLSQPFIVTKALAAAAAFSLLSGAVYLLNDIADVEADRAHPVKRNRPIASGVVSVPLARWACLGILAIALTVATLLSPWVAVVSLGYFTMNVAYSLRLKHVAFIDVGIIATGFLLRVLAGSLAIGVPVSTWLFLCTFLLSLYLALGKRLHELNLKGRKQVQRKVLERYHPRHVFWATSVVGLLSVASYTAYTLAPETPITLHLGWPRLVATAPFALFGVWRFFSLATSGRSAKSPTEQMLKDIPFLANFGTWVVVLLAIIFWR